MKLKAYDGPIILIDKEEEVKAAVEEMSLHKYVGVDTESKPAFKKGVYNYVALIQLYIPGKCFLIRLNKTGMTDEFVEFLENPKITKVGLALRDDIKDLQKLRPCRPVNFLELQTFVKAFNILDNSLRKITAITLGFRISKSSQVSNWEAQVLDDQQLRYAATDAWVCIKIYNKLLSSIK